VWDTMEGGGRRREGGHGKRLTYCPHNRRPSGLLRHKRNYECETQLASLIGFARSSSAFCPRLSPTTLPLVGPCLGSANRLTCSVGAEVSTNTVTQRARNRAPIVPGTRACCEAGAKRGSDEPAGEAVEHAPIAANDARGEGVGAAPAHEGGTSLEAASSPCEAESTEPRCEAAKAMKRGRWRRETEQPEK